MFNCEWRKHCWGVCVCLCVIYASHTQDYRWRPLWAHMAEGCGYVTATWGSATPDWSRTGSKCTKAPILINTTYLRQTEQITLPATPPQHHHPIPKNKLALPCKQTIASAYTLKAMVLLLWGTYRGKWGPDYSFGPICFHRLAILNHTI